MKVTPLDRVERHPRRVAIGTFDGVHLGHREVIKGNDTVLTFDPHPVSVIRPQATPKLLTDLERKAELIEQLGVKELVVIPFDEQFAQLTAQAFVDQILVEQLQATTVAVGENFRFGNRASGGPALLAAQTQFETRVAPMVEIEGETVSSSHIRGLILAGEVDHATVFLGSPFQVHGEVVTGDGRGRELGFATANLVPRDEMICPGYGVYAGFANGHPTAISVGVRPTFGSGREVLIESHLIDFDGDLYGQQLRVEFLKRLRGERVFGSAGELVTQMGHDVEAARQVCRDQSATL